MNKLRKRSLRQVRYGRRLIQTGFLFLFLFPWLPVLLAHINGRDVPSFSSWLLPFDLLLNGAKVLHGDFLWIAAGAAFFLLTGSCVFGRSFCGWICPLGTILDWIRPVVFWQKERKMRPSSQNSPMRFRLLAFVLAASFLSLQFLGWFDPIVIFNRTASSLITNFFLMDLSNLRLVPLSVSLLFISIIAMEFFQPRFWCRNLCPFVH